MRSIWKGSIAFGLVNAPVKVYSATEDHDIRFHQVHAKDGGRIKYNRVCSECGQTVQFADIDKAYDSEEGDRVILTDEDFEKLPAAEKREIPVLQVRPHRADRPDPVREELLPRTGLVVAQGLRAAREALAQTDRTALVHFTLRQKTRLAALRERDGVLAIQTLLWPDEVRAAEFPSLEDADEPKPKELAMAGTLVDSMAEDFDPTEFTDDYQIELRQLLDEAIASGGKKVIPAAERVEVGADAEVVDLVAALQRSLEAAGEETKPAPEKKARRKRA
ncbi:Ku protein [Prescottella defluvii]|nr:Ku protein [Prescottella defluvii]